MSTAIFDSFQAPGNQPANFPFGLRIGSGSTNGINDVGVAGQRGFGVGICPGPLPSGMVGIQGYNDPASDNYGNYQYADGSIMVWVPAFYYRVAHADNPTYGVHGVNSVHIVPESTYANVAAANAAGYALHRAFIDGGAQKRGFFVDKYMCSKAAWGTGYIASSVKNGLPISFHADHNPISGLTACTAGVQYYRALDAAHARDGVNGAVNASSIFFCCSRFVYSALALLSLAHGQAATAATYCAWYSATTTNFPKGCNNNALADTNDTAVKWESDGYSNCGKTGSAGYGGGAGNVFAKSTHNGQGCGVADLNGLMWEVSTGITCIASSPAIGGITSAAAPVFTINTHGLTAGDVIQINSITQADWVNFKDKMWTVASTPDANTFTLTSAPDCSGYAAYDPVADPGTITKGAFHIAKEATAMRAFTSGNSAATDHWGATGVAAMMQAFAPAFETTYNGNGYGLKFGDGAGQVLAEDLSGDSWLRTGLGIPDAAAGISAAGTNLFGLDYFYQYVVNELFLLSGGYWGSSTGAGVWTAAWYYARGGAGSTTGFRLACVPV